MNKLKRKFGKRMKYNYKRTFFGMFLFLLFISFGVGYAYLTTSLSIDGTSNVSSARWNIHFANIDINEDSVTPTTGATITNPTTINFSLVLSEPGDFYEFTVDIVNEGTLNARISDFSFLPELTAEQQEYYEYIVKYASGSDIAVGDGLKAGTSEKIIVFLKQRTNENNVFKVTTSYKAIAEYINVDRSNFMRELNKMEEENLIKKEGRIMYLYI